MISLCLINPNLMSLTKKRLTTSNYRPKLSARTIWNLRVQVIYCFMHFWFTASIYSIKEGTHIACYGRGFIPASAFSVSMGVSFCSLKFLTNFRLSKSRFPIVLILIFKLPSMIWLWCQQIKITSETRQLINWWVNPVLKGMKKATFFTQLHPIPPLTREVGTL